MTTIPDNDRDYDPELLLARLSEMRGDELQAWGLSTPSVLDTFVMVVSHTRLWKPWCFPSVALLATESGYSVRQVQRGLARLEGSDLIRREQRHRENSSQTSNVIVVQWRGECHPPKLNFALRSFAQRRKVAGAELPQRTTTQHNATQQVGGVTEHHPARSIGERAVMDSVHPGVTP